MKIEIGAVTYTVRQADDASMRDDGWLGTCNKRTLEILVRGDLAPSRTAETICHEISHGINNEYCNSGLTEDQVSGVGQGLAQVLHHFGIELAL